MAKKGEAKDRDASRLPLGDFPGVTSGGKATPPLPGDPAPEFTRTRAGAKADATLQRTRRNFVLAVMAGLALLSYLVFKPFISYVFMGLLFAYLAWPLQKWLTKRLKKPVLAATAVLLLFVILFAAPLVFIGYELVDTIGDVANAKPEDTAAAVEKGWIGLSQTLGFRGPNPGEARHLVDVTSEKVNAYISEHAGDALLTAAELLIGMVVFLFVLFYGLVDGEAMLGYAMDASPLDDELDRELLGEIGKTVDAVFMGHVIVSVIQGLLGGVSFYIFGIPNVPFWTFILIIAALIPLVGTLIVWVPAALYLIATGHTVAAIGLVIFNAILVTAIDQFARPYVVGKKADVHPVIVLVGVLGGLTAFGFIGFVLGPLVVAMLVAIINFWRRDFLPAYEAEHAIHPDAVKNAAAGIAGAIGAGVGNGDDVE